MDKKVVLTAFAFGMMGFSVHADTGTDDRERHIPNDPLFAKQWALDNDGRGGRTADADIDAPEAWSITRGSADVVIAVLDDGTETGHPDLAANVSAAGRDFAVSPPGADPNPKTSRDRHGTAVAGVAAARGDNHVGIVGGCPNCTLLPIRVVGESSAATAAAYRYAVGQGADIITSSWGYPRAAPEDSADPVELAIEEVAIEGRNGLGAVVVFGMTNETVDNCQAPNLDISSLDSVIAVGVSDHNDHIGGSGYGACMDVVAPAKPRYRTTIGVMTTDRTGLAGHTANDYHSTFGGTSAAAPLVAGVAGLLLSLNPELTRTEVQRILEHTADKIDPNNARYDERGFSTRAGHGRINAAQALVPTVQIVVSPSEVWVGQPFSITVTATAPYGIERVSWRGRDTDPKYFDWSHEQLTDQRAYYRRTWTGLTLDESGTFRFEATVRDVRHAAGDDGYPHSAKTRADTVAGLITVSEAP